DRLVWHGRLLDAPAPPRRAAGRERAAGDHAPARPLALRPARHHRGTLTKALVVLCLGVFLTALDQTVVVTALPSMLLELRVPTTRLAEASWIVNGYLLGYAVALPVAGRLADLYGHRRGLGTALGAFAVTSAICALAPSLYPMIGARVLQAMAGGAV